MSKHRAALKDLYQLLEIAPKTAFDMAVDDLIARIERLESQLATTETALVKVSNYNGRLEQLVEQRNSFTYAEQAKDVARWLDDHDMLEEADKVRKIYPFGGT